MKKDLINQIDDALIEFCLSSDKETIQAIITEEGGNSTSDIERKKKFANKINFFAKANSQKHKKESLLQKATNIFKDAIEKNTEKPISILKGMIKEGQLSVQFRSLDKLREEDIKEIIREKNLIELIEQLENDEP